MAVFMIGARTPEGWDFLFEKYRTSLQMSVKSRMKIAMTTSPLQDKLVWWGHGKLLCKLIIDSVIIDCYSSLSRLLRSV